jgi:16S rRNA (guanine966-N2)-methyltransferase
MINLINSHVRIIAGYWRGKHIPVPNNEMVRPTGDRIRETLFNWLGPRIHEAHCLDLFAGSGILGLEALSRGATQVTFVDSDPKVLKPLEKIVTSLHLDKNKIRVSLSLQSALLPIIPAPTPYDIIFLDPPFQGDLLEQCIPLLKRYAYEKPGTWVYIETQSARTLTLPSHWHSMKQGKAGQVAYQLIEVGT